jgi:hypothetical protein
LAAYQSLFRALFKLLRAEAALVGAWRELRGRREYRAMSDVVGLLRRHAMDDTVQTAWLQLERALERPRPPEQLLAEHVRFLARLAAGSLLAAPALRRAFDELLETVLALCHGDDAAATADWPRQLALFVDVLQASKVPGDYLMQLVMRYKTQL